MSDDLIREKFNEHSKEIDLLKNKLENIYDLTMAVKEIAIEMKAMREDMNKIDKRVMAIEDKPSKRMDMLWGYIVSALVGGLIGYVFIQLGLK